MLRNFTHLRAVSGWATHLCSHLVQFPANRRHSTTPHPHNNHTLDMKTRNPLILDTRVRKLSHLTHAPKGPRNPSSVTHFPNWFVLYLVSQILRRALNISIQMGNVNKFLNSSFFRHLSDGLGNLDKNILKVKVSGKKKWGVVKNTWLGIAKLSMISWFLYDSWDS